jgi:peptide/nickel transport system substrate-binding protein
MRRRQILTAMGALAAPSIARAADTGVLRFVPSTGLAILDPVWTPTTPTLPFGLAMFESLYSVDERLQGHPQMAAGHTIEDDGKRWNIRLRDGLRFHDGEPVLARDCVASIERWMKRDAVGKTLASRLNALEASDDRNVVFRLKKPFPQLPFALGKAQPNILPIMPARIAATDPGQQIKEIVGSGPFRFVPEEFQAGSLAVQAKFDRYVPRDETPFGTSGGRVAKVDRIEWRAIPDPATAVGALIKGEVDWIETPLNDLIPTLRKSRDVVVDIFNPWGLLPLLRPNFVSGPTANPAIRRAILAALDQAEMMAAVTNDEPGIATTPVGVFVPGSPAANRAGLERIGPKPPAAIKEMLKQAGYNGERIVLLHPTDQPANDALCHVIARRLTEAGFNLDDQVMDFATLVMRRNKREAPDAGGWSLVIPLAPGADHISPMVALALRTGAAAWNGWPEGAEVETLREQWVDSADPAEQQRIAAKIQEIALNDVLMIPLGHYRQRSAWRSNVSGILQAPYPVMWNVSKT